MKTVISSWIIVMLRDQECCEIATVKAGDKEGYIHMYSRRDALIEKANSFSAIGRFAAGFFFFFFLTQVPSLETNV